MNASHFFQEWEAWAKRLCTLLSSSRCKQAPVQNRDRVVQQAVAEYRESLSLHSVPYCLERLTYIAWRHRTVRRYRGFLLHTDEGGNTVLIDLSTLTYLKAAPNVLLQITGYVNACAFIDHLYTMKG